MPKIALPDGSERVYENPVTAAQIAADIGPGLAKAALAAVVNDENWDINRVIEEYKAFSDLNMIPMLRYLIYLVDVMRENNVVWGVGRGSSVASYVLYLIGIHKVDSIKHNLDYREFLR